MTDRADDSPVLFAYDGSEHAKAAIRQAGRQLGEGRPAIVLTVWNPLATVPLATAAGLTAVGLHETIEREARRVAEEGAELARSSGFDAQPVAEMGEPVWQQIVDSAEEHHAGIVVMGSHGRTGIGMVLLGSVAAATARHTERPVLIAHAGAQPSSGKSL
jgi:nucleotide-binding universal stress UspA family protein